MNQSFLLHIENETTLDIPFGEIMFISVLKANQLNDHCEEIYIIQVSVGNNTSKKNSRVKAVIKVQTNNGEYTGYSLASRWEESITKGFETIIRQLIIQTHLPAQQKQNTGKERATALNIFSEN